MTRAVKRTKRRVAAASRIRAETTKPAPDRKHPADPEPSGDPPLSPRRMRRLFPGIGNKRASLDDVMRSASPLIPPRTVARRTLLALIAIMSFLACLSVGAVSIVGEKSRSWQRQISEEVTIQVRPVSGGDVSDLVQRAVDLAVQIPGVRNARALSDEEGRALLEPWLGRDFNAATLPVPRLVAVRISQGADLVLLDRRLREEVSGATLDDHGLWLARLSGMADFIVGVGVGIVGLVLMATALSIAFATRGAMAGNHVVIEVLHFIGAEDSYIASAFQRHFLALGLKGASIGGLIAIGLFLAARLASDFGGAAIEDAQIQSLFGGFQVGLAGYVAAATIALVIAVAVALTARITVLKTIADLG